MAFSNFGVVPVIDDKTFGFAGTEFSVQCVRRFVFDLGSEPNSFATPLTRQIENAFT